MKAGSRALPPRVVRSTPCRGRRRDDLRVGRASFLETRDETVTKAAKTARWTPGRGLPAVVLMLGASSLWLYHHVTRFEDFDTGVSAFEVVYAFAYLMFFLQVLLATFDRPRQAKPRRAAALAKMRVVAVVPLYNEDVDAVIATIRGLLAQTRLPDAIF